MITDSIRALLGERRREISAKREHKRFEDMIANVDAALFELDEHENGANERALALALDELKKHVFMRLIDNRGNTSVMPLTLEIADGRTIREVCADEINAVTALPRISEEVADAERYVNASRERIEEARETYIKPLEENLASDIRMLETVKKSAADAAKALDALKRKYRVA